MDTEYRCRLDSGVKYSVLPSADSAMPSEATPSGLRLPSGASTVSGRPSTTGTKVGSTEVAGTPLKRRMALPLAMSMTMIAPGPRRDESVR
ncbi:hypothetical protein D3C78_1463310 [compost metagenome]